MKQTFKTTIKNQGDKDTAYIEPPFDVEAVFGAKRVKVKATFDGVDYRGSLVKMKGCYMVGLTQTIRKQIGKSVGDEVLVTLEKDEEERVVEMPELLVNALKINEKANSAFHRLSYTAQKEYANAISSAKREETQMQRLEKTIAALEAMAAEKQQPKKHNIFTMAFAKVYPMYIQKVEKKGRTQEEVDTVICWLTGYDAAGLQNQIDEGVSIETFFEEAPQINENANKITGVICGVRIENIEDPLMKKIRWLDKLVDELAKGRPMEKVLKG